MNLAPSVCLADRYTLTERIATGGMGEVWKARDELLSRTVAVKVLRPEYADDPDFLARFRDEARHSAALSHPGIATVFDYGEADDTAYLVMEYVAGQPLSALLSAQTRLPADRALDIVGQAALALQAAHEAGVVHRDVKPGNLLVRPDGVVKVTDFGIARAGETSAITRTGFVVGTAAYLSPEQAAGRPATPASDVYALGVVAYECLAGVRPFVSDSAVAVALAHTNQPPPALPRDVPPVVADFVTQTLAKDPARRPRDAGEFGRTALALAARLRDVPAPTATPVTPTRLLPISEPAAAGSAAVDEEERHRKRIRNVFVAVGVAVVIVGFAVLRTCSGPVNTVVMPSVTGGSYARAAAALHIMGLNVVERVASSTTTKGDVLRQDPKAGVRIGAGSTVTLTVSSGPTLVQINAADYLQQPVATVMARLLALGLRVVIGGTAPGPDGVVVGLSPTGPVPQGSTITLTVGGAPKEEGKHDHGGGDQGGGGGGD